MKLESAKTQADQIILDARARAEAEQEKALERTRQEADSMLEKSKMRTLLASRRRQQRPLRLKVAKSCHLSSEKDCKDR
mgnify:CR=1 FL=1